MATMNISVPDPMKEWVQAQIDSGQYANASDYLRDLIRKDQARKSQLRALQKAITEGVESGPATELNMESLLAEFKQKHGKG